MILLLSLLVSQFGGFLRFELIRVVLPKVSDPPDRIFVIGELKQTQNWEEPAEEADTAKSKNKAEAKTKSVTQDVCNKQCKENCESEKDRTGDHCPDEPGHAEIISRFPDETCQSQIGSLDVDHASFHFCCPDDRQACICLF